jgi:hypothetical protein
MSERPDMPDPVAWRWHVLTFLVCILIWCAGLFAVTH